MDNPGDRNFTSKLSQALGASVASVNIFPSITASLGNALILIAPHKVSSIYPPTKLFFRCLAVTDLCVGLLVHPLFATDQLSRITEMSENDLYYVYEVSRATNWILRAVSVLTMTAISVDRLLALLLGLRYRHVVTLRRARIAIICFWFIGVSVGSIRIWRYNFYVSFCLLDTFSGNFHCLLHKDPSQITTSTSPKTKQHSPKTSERRRVPTEYGKI